MTKHETREYAFLLLYEAMVRTEELNTIEDLYASTEEMLELPIPEKVKQYVSGVMSQTEELDFSRSPSFPAEYSAAST